MDNRVPQPIESVESILQEARKVLYAAVSSAEAITEKIHGPRPSDPSNCSEGYDSLRSVADDIRRLAHRVTDELAEHHNSIGFERAQPAVGRAVGR
jgi:hypothetical protein